MNNFSVKFENGESTNFIPSKNKAVIDLWSFESYAPESDWEKIME